MCWLLRREDRESTNDVSLGFSYGGADSDSGAVAATLEPRGWWDTTAPFARCRDRQLPPPAARGAPWFPLPDARQNRRHTHWRCRTRPAASSAALVLQECSTCSSHLVGSLLPKPILAGLVLGRGRERTACGTCSSRGSLVEFIDDLERQNRALND